MVFFLFQNTMGFFFICSDFKVLIQLDPLSTSEANFNTREKGCFFVLFFSLKYDWICLSIYWHMGFSHTSHNHCSKNLLQKLILTQTRQLKCSYVLKWNLETREFINNLPCFVDLQLHDRRKILFVVGDKIYRRSGNCKSTYLVKQKS